MDQAILAWREGRAGRIRLNRPKTLHALDLTMVNLIREAVADFKADPLVHVILVDAPERGFCAGGDVKAARAAVLSGLADGVNAFFEAEYAMNQEISDCPKPFISMIDGVCMGGGIGLSVHGSHRIASERAMFAMPETAIALFPDVGTSFILPRLPGALGMYLGLTGARLQGADGVHAGFATHFIHSAQMESLTNAITADGASVIAEFVAPLPPFSLATHRGVIDHAFSAESVTGIISRLVADDSEFARHTMLHLRAHSPLSIHWSFEIIQAGAERTLPQALIAELALVRKVALHPEFLEGVRAVLVDKDRAPKWHPRHLEDVDTSQITEMFS